MKILQTEIFLLMVILYIFSVTDKGAGIPAEFQSRIFQKFSQVDALDTRSKGGTSY